MTFLLLVEAVEVVVIVVAVIDMTIVEMKQGFASEYAETRVP